MQGVKSDTDPRQGWFKLLIPDIKEVFSGLFWNERLKVEPLPFMYGRLDPDQTAFDCALSVPFLAVDRACLVQVDSRPETQQPAGPDQVAFQLQMIPLKMLALDQESRCYIPTDVVTCIIPLDTRHPMVAALVQITSESGLIIPSGPGMSDAPLVGQQRIVDMSGRDLRVLPPPKEGQEDGQS